MRKKYKYKQLGVEVTCDCRDIWSVWLYWEEDLKPCKVITIKFHFESKNQDVVILAALCLVDLIHDWYSLGESSFNLHRYQISKLCT